MPREIVITDVTMYGKLRCVAGYDATARVMVRPEPEPQGFWNAVYCGEHSVFHPGRVVEFDGFKPDTPFPHRTEDIVVAGQPTPTGVLSAKAFRTVLAQAADVSVDRVFAERLVFEGSKAYVPAGSECGSLAGLILPVDQVTLFVNEYNGKRRLRVRLPLRGRPVDLSVTAKDFRQIFERQGLDGANALVADSRRIHVRLGLARPWPDYPDRCYLQTNGLYGL